MQQFVLIHELAIRLRSLAAIFAGMALWEVLAPRRKRVMSTLMRWSSNSRDRVPEYVLVAPAFPDGGGGACRAR
jgi:predicted small integral membrane protein